MYIVVAIIAFSALIAVHELGHFTAAKLLGVKVNEFAIGMGPKILKRQGKETLYALRLLPFGGFCAMDEDVESDDPRSFSAQKRWRRVIILAAGGIANLIVACIIIVIVVAGMPGFTGTTITEFADGFQNEGEDGLMVGDTIISINGERLYYLDDYTLFMQLSTGSKVDLVVRRDGKTIRLDGFDNEFAGVTITEFAEGFPSEGADGLLVGDTIISINGERVNYISDFTRAMQLVEGDYIDLIIRRGSETVRLNQFRLVRREYLTNGEMQLRYGLSLGYTESDNLGSTVSAAAGDARLRYGISFNQINGNFIEKIKYSGYTAINYVRLIRVSLAQLFSGKAGITDLAGPVAIVDAMNDIGQTSSSVGAALRDIVSFAAFIGVNIAVVNLLPIPAMDGGRILFVLINWVIEKTMKRRISPKYEGYIHTGALILLMGLMVFVLINDVVRIASG